MITTVTCEQCGKKFTGWFTRRFCDECKRLRNIDYTRRRAAQRTEEEKERHRALSRQWYHKKRERVKATRRAWLAEHPDYLRQWRLKRKETNNHETHHQN